MRRLTVVQLLPALESGGVEHSTIEISGALVAAGHRSIVVSAGGRLLPALRDTGAKVLAIAGNHDSAATFDAYRPLLDAVDITASSVRWVEEPTDHKEPEGKAQARPRAAATRAKKPTSPTQ